MIFYKLTDAMRYGDIIRAEGRKHYTYSFGPFKWVRTTIMMAYMNPDSPLYGEYEEVSAEEAQKLVIAKGNKLSRLLKEAESLARKTYIGQMDEYGNSYIGHLEEVVKLLDDYEQKTAAWLQSIYANPKITAEVLLQQGYYPRIVQAVNLLAPKKNFLEQVQEIRKNPVARAVMSVDLECRLNINQYTTVDENLEKKLEMLRGCLAYLQMEGELPKEHREAKSEFVPSMQVFVQVRERALQGRKIPHGISNPVLRKEGDNLYLAFFVYYYKKADLDAKEMPRPSMWILADIKSGEIKKRISCADRDFSSEKQDARFSMEYPDKPVFDDKDFQRLYNKLDAVRRDYTARGIVDEEAYQKYFKAMILQIPPAYRVFYQELSIL